MNDSHAIAKPRKPSPTGPAIYFDGTLEPASRGHAALRRPAGNRRGRTGAGDWAYADIRRVDSPAGHAARELPDGAGAGAAGDSRRSACRRTGLPLRQARRRRSGPPRRRRDRRLVAGRHRLDRRRGAVRRAARRRPAGAAGAARVRAAARRCRRRPGQDSCSATRSATIPPGQEPSSSSSPRCAKSAGLDTSVQSGVLSSSIPNAFALPGGKVYLFNGLLAKAENRRRDRGRAGPRTRPSQASRQHARHDPRRRHVVPGRPVVRRYHRLQRVDLRVRARW